MKLKPIAFIKTLNWGKEDVKKILMLVIMLLIICFILNNFLFVKVKITQGRRDSISIDGSIDTYTSVNGAIDTSVSGPIDTYVSGSVDVYGNIDTTVVNFLDELSIRQ